MATINFQGGRIILGTGFAGYKFGIFEAGTTTAKTTYKDSGLTVGNENTAPVVLDANGAAQIWFSGNAKVIFYTAADVVVYTDDNVNLEASSSATGADNLILNGSFEDDADADGIPDNWTRTLYTGGAFTIDTTTQMHGSDSAKFTSTGTGGGYITSTSTFAIKPSTTYTVGFSLKSSVADVRNVATVYWYKADGTASATATTDVYDDSTTNPTSWTEKWYETASPSDAYFAKVRLTGCHSSDATSGSTWFDNVIFSGAAIKRANNTFSGTVTMSGKSIYEANASVVANATTSDIWSGGNYVTLTGTATTFTDFADAPQAGIEVELYCNAAHTFTNNANLILDVPGTFTATIGDKVKVRSRSTTVFELTVPKTIVQIVNYQTGEVAAGTGTIPQDDTIPQNTEGTEFMQLTFTPKSATNKLLIEVLACLSSNIAEDMTCALFQDTTANALAAVGIYNTSEGMRIHSINHYMTAGTTSPTTFKVRAGTGGASTTTFNGRTSARRYGGVASSSITITEIRG